VRRLAQIARAKGATPAQLALAWLLARGQDIVPIPGTKRLDRLEENVGALRVRLDADDLRWIDEALPPGAGAGGRYPEAQMKGVYL
jgi:aryl-alcohol dehydrogenase-like predicted oxidoreductase